MAHVDKAGQLADLGMVHCKSFSTRTDGGKIVLYSLLVIVVSAISLTLASQCPSISLVFHEGGVT